MDNALPSTGRCPMRATPTPDDQPSNAPEMIKRPSKPISRRTPLKVGGIGAMAASSATVGAAAWRPQRAMASTSSSSLPDIQHDIGAFVHPAQTIAGVPVDFGVLYTFLAPVALTCNPTKTDQQVFSAALTTIEETYSAGSAASGAIVTFAGSSSAVLTTAKPGDYFTNGSIQHLPHVIDDLEQFDSTIPADPETFRERIQDMFRSKTSSGTPGLPFQQDPNDPFTDGGGLGAPTGNFLVPPRRNRAFPLLEQT